MQQYTVGRNIKGKSDPITVEAEDALAAALKAKEQAPKHTSTSETNAAISGIRTTRLAATQVNAHGASLKFWGSSGSLLQHSGTGG